MDTSEASRQQPEKNTFAKASSKGAKASVSSLAVNAKASDASLSDREKTDPTKSNTAKIDAPSHDDPLEESSVAVPPAHADEHHPGIRSTTGRTRTITSPPGEPYNEDVR